ncbi:MAG TPA: aromatic acid exporter family protein [Bacillus sp. (in: firmicutes)]|nr:aromatic acid exporter family protein [Bacillus sp. (in: firmicutes)]
MFKIGYRTIKTAVGAVVSIMIAQLFQLENFASAGILTILCIKPTKRKSLKAAIDRFVACFIALLFASLFFELISYHPIVIGILLLVFIPVTVKLTVQDGIVTASVIILHVYMAEKITVSFLLNEVFLIVIGLLVALLLNLYMPSLDKKLLEIRDEVELHISNILRNIANYLKINDEGLLASEITGLDQAIQRGKALAFKDYENRLLQEENLYFTYFAMREKQFHIIERVLSLLASFQFNTSQRIKVADFIQELSDHVHSGNTAHHFLYKLYRLKHDFDQMELPKSRQELEEHAALLNFVREMEQYLQIKSHFKGLYDPGQKMRRKKETAE